MDETPERTISTSSSCSLSSRVCLSRSAAPAVLLQGVLTSCDMHARSSLCCLRAAGGPIVRGLHPRRGPAKSDGQNRECVPTSIGWSQPLLIRTLRWQSQPSRAPRPRPGLRGRRAQGSTPSLAIFLKRVR